jgi:hypothetical protein
MAKSINQLRISQTPPEHWNKVFGNLMKFRGPIKSAQCVIDDVLLSEAFPWILTDEGHFFWMMVNGDLSKEDYEQGQNLKKQAEVSAIHSDLDDFLSNFGISLN